MNRGGSIFYLDSSAVVKLVVREAESDALRERLGRRPDMATSALARVEVSRVLRRVGLPPGTGRMILAGIAVLPVEEDILEIAATLEPPGLRTLDAIHLASALSLGEALGTLVAYDRRMVEAAGGLGLPVLSPAD